MNTDHQPQQPPTRDDYGQIAPESARTATLAPEQPVKAPGRDGDIFLARGTVVEVEWPTGSRIPYYVDEGGFQITAGKVGNGKPYPWSFGRIVRVLTEDKPTQEPVLPRQIAPEDVRPGMVVDISDRVRITKVDDHRVWISDYEGTELHREGRSWWLIEDAPESEGDPDAELVERMARAMDAEPGFNVSDMAYAALRALREIRDVTPRAEQ